MRGHLRSIDDATEDGDEAMEVDDEQFSATAQDEKSDAEDEHMKADREENIKVDEELCSTSELDRPSEYLRRRCPLCFGGEWTEVPKNEYIFPFILQCF